MGDFLDVVGQARDDDVSQDMHLTIQFKSHLESFFLDRGQVDMVDGELVGKVRPFVVQSLKLSSSEPS